MPKGLYMEEMVKNIRGELIQECDYLAEAEAQLRFKKILENDPRYYIPEVKTEWTTDRIITSEFISGVDLEELAEAGS